MPTITLDYCQDPLLAQAQAQAKPPHCILLDLMMPKMDGFELLQRFRNTPQTQQIPIVMLTSNEEPLQKAQAFSLGANDYLIKLPDEVEMLARLRYYGKAYQAQLQQRAAEKELIDRESHLRAILCNALDAIITFDSIGHIVDANPAAGRLFGFPYQEMLGLEMDKVVLSEEFWCAHIQLLNDYTTIQTNAIIPTFKKRWEVDGLREDGKRIDLDMAIIANTQLGGLHFTAFLQDITDRKQLLKSLEETLGVAEYASRIKSDFLATMSHEIRTPMNAVIGLTDLALQADLPAKAYDYMTKVFAASHVLMRIINDVLDFSKMDAGKLKLEFVRFELKDVFEQLARLFRNQAEAKGLELIMEIAPDCPSPLFGDAMRLEQILTNLIGNAIKFTAVGVVDCRVRVIEPPVAQSIKPVKFEFSIQDTGIGLTAEQIERLFNPFVQADSSTTRKYGGTGLGLSICKRLVKLMGGHIGIESVAGQGSVFRFSLEFAQHMPEAETLSTSTQPLLKLDDRTMAAMSEQNIVKSYRSRKKEIDLTKVTETIGGACVLLVEDTYINQQITQEMLVVVGVHCDVVDNGADALLMLEERVYDLVIMDIQMPIMDGYDATRTIRKNPRLQQLPIIAMTAHATFDDQEYCLEVGMNDHIGKPVDRALLYTVLMRWINMEGRPREVFGPVSPDMADADILKIPAVLPGFNVRQGLRRVGGDHSFFRSLLLAFEQDFSKADEKIQILLTGRRQDDLKSAFDLAHAIRGMAANLSAQRLTEVATRLELAIKENRQADWPVLVDDFEIALRQVMHAIRTLPREDETCDESAESATRANVDRAVLIPLLTELARLIDERNTDALPRLQSLQFLLRGAGVGKELDQLALSLDQLDFDDAQAPLKAIVDIIKP